jgi:hypothetical protein
MLWWDLDKDGRWACRDRHGRTTAPQLTLHEAIVAWSIDHAHAVQQGELAALHALGDNRVLYLGKEANDGPT